MLKLPVKPPIVNENIDLSEYAKKSDVDAIGTSLGNKAEKKEVEKINSQLDTLTKKVDDEIKEIQSTTDTFKENINTSFNEFSNEQQNNFEALREEVLSDIEASYVGYDNEQHLNLESRLNSDFDKINQRVNDSSYLEYEGTSIKADNTYYGLTKDTVIKGRTLQNLMDNSLIKKNSFSMYGGTTIEENEEYFVANRGGSELKCSLLLQSKLLKPNTKYTLILSKKDVNTEVQIYDNAKETFLLRKDNITRAVFTTLDTVKSIYLYFLHNTDSTVNSIKVYKNSIIILEGDHTSTPIEELPFVEGIQGTGDLSKNLFNIKSATSGHIRADGTLNASAINNIASIKMNVTSSKLYARTVGGHQTGGYFSFYDSNDTFISTTYRTNNAEMIVPSNAKKFIFHTQYFKANTDYSEEAFNNANIMVSTEPIDKQLPYYDGYKVSGKSCGKNLINCSEWSKTSEATVNANEDGSFTLTTLSSWKGIMFKDIKLKSNTTYTLNCKSSQSNIGMYVRVKKSNGNYNAQADWGGKLPAKFTTGNNAPIVQVTIETISALENVIISEIQLEENSIATAYEPYQESTYSYILDEPLRKLPNGVADSINLETGVLTRRVGKTVLDDGIYWYFGSHGAGGTDTTMAETHQIRLKALNSKIGGMCDKIQVVTANHLWTYTETETIISFNVDGAIHIRIKNDILDECTLAGFKRWIKANPVTVLYELAEPTTEQLTPTQLKSFEGTTHIISNNTLQAHTNVKIPSNVQAVVTNLINENKALRSNVDILNVENEGLKETNEVQDELIDINMMATDEVYTMIEPLLASQPQIMSMERGASKLVDMYVAMVQRGLKTIDQVPIRYRAEVQAILEALEK